jgi:diguanylate cyclase (GGDEF)-like protein
MTFRRLRLPDYLVAPVVLAALTCATLPFFHVLVAAAGIVAPLTFVLAAAAQLATLAVLVALIAAIRRLLRWRSRALSLEIFLADQLHHVANHSRRLESLWKVASGPPLSDDAFLHVLLTESSAAIHEGPEFRGSIAHLDGVEIVVDLQQRYGVIDGALGDGARMPLADTLLGEVLRTGKTCSWADVRADAAIAAIPRVRTMPWRAFISTPFRVGPTVYFLTFTSQSALVEPFVPDDHAYLEIVASFCALRLQQRAQFDRLRHESAHDPLTGLPNRTAFRVAGARALASGEPFALAVVDVDRFRTLNEALGHQTADAVLVEIAAAIGARVAGGDVVARLGGDTFGVLLRDAATRADAERRVERVHTAFSAPFGTGDREGKERVPVTASIGVAVAPDDGPSFERLLAHADTAVLRAKESGRARWSFFDRRKEEAFFLARTLQNDLALALVRDEFVLHFSPHVEIATGRVVGAEALIRWNHPERGLLSPADFVPFAEEHGMLGSIGAWVMRETVRISRARRRDEPGFRAWFNLSASELADPMLLRRLQDLGEDLTGIGVEISETVAMHDIRATLRTVGALRDAGLAIALDDFGTGYSSLEHLKRLPLDLVKIDRAFTAGVPDDPHDAAIVEAVIGIATRYGFATLAEGVETQRQADYLASAGCRYAQGFVYAQPVAADVFFAALRSPPSRSSGDADHQSAPPPTST